MAANTALRSTIETGLKQAEWFILLATPASANSSYVNTEIDWWLRHKGPQQLRQRNAAREQARIAQSRQLAATARSIADTEVGKARLLAVQAYRLVPELQTEGALLSTLTASPQLIREFDAGSRVWDTAGTADGRRVMAANNVHVASKIELWRGPAAPKVMLQLESNTFSITRPLRE